MSAFSNLIGAMMWPTIITHHGETISHDPAGATLAYTATLVFDDSDAVKAQKANKVAALISGPASSFTSTPARGDTFTRGSDTYLCVDVDDDKIGGWNCWCRLKSST